MINNKASGQAYNRFTHLDGIEDRIIYYLLSPNKKGKCANCNLYQGSDCATVKCSDCALANTFKIWRLLCYNDADALTKPLPEYKDVVKLVCSDNNQQDKFRIFRSCHLEDAWTIQSTFLKIYIDSIMPENPYIAQVNIGIDVIVHNKIINVDIPEEEQNEIVPIDTVNGIDYRITQKSRVSMLTKAILSILNGADIQGVGRLEFSMEMNRFQQAQYEIWNNRNFEGMKMVLGTRFSGVS